MNIAIIFICLITIAFFIYNEKTITISSKRLTKMSIIIFIILTILSIIILLKKDYLTGISLIVIAITLCFTKTGICNNGINHYRNFIYWNEISNATITIHYNNTITLETASNKDFPSLQYKFSKKDAIEKILKDKSINYTVEILSPSNI